LAWRLEEGFTHAFLYSRRIEVLSGIYADDPYLGGARAKGNGAAPEGGADHDDDPVKVSIACAWFRLLMEIEDTQPNADNTKGSVQIEGTTERELYDEYCSSLQEADVAAGHVLTFCEFKRLWGSRFDEVAIVKAKNLLSKVAVCH
jgi:hypothetical protein